MEARLNPLLTRELTQILSEPRVELAGEGALLVAARMLSRAAPDQMTATTVVGVVDRDDVARLRALVIAIAQDSGLETTVNLGVGSFTVRFYRPRADGSGTGA